MPQVPKEVVYQAAPKYIRHLDALGLSWEHLFDWETGRWKLRRKDIDGLIGKETREFLERIAKPVVENRWQTFEGKVLQKQLRRLEKVLPEKVIRELKRKESVSSLTLHYLKRRYLDGMEFKSEAEYVSWIKQQLRDLDNLIFTQGKDIVIYNPKSKAVIAIAGDKGFLLSAYVLTEYGNYWEKAAESGETFLAGIVKEYLSPILDFLGTW